MPLPYEGARAGIKARDEITKILRRFGCGSIGFMDDFSDQSVMLAFTVRDRKVQLRASAKGWAAAFLKENPWSYRRRGTQDQYKQKAIDQGLIAVNSILRDWVKGQITAVETGILEFDAVFLPYMLMADGRPAIEHFENQLLLEAHSPTETKE